MRTLSPMTARCVKLRDNALHALAAGQPDCWNAKGKLIVARAIAPAGIDRRSFTHVTSGARLIRNEDIAGLIWVAQRNHGLSQGAAYELLFEGVVLGASDKGCVAA